MWITLQPEGPHLFVAWPLLPTPPPIGGGGGGGAGNPGSNDIIGHAQAALDVLLDQRVLVGAKLGEKSETKPLKEMLCNCISQEVSITPF